jgi:hypothetical protein
VEVVHARCAGLDISKRDAKVCVRVAGAGRRKTVETVTTWASMTSQILALTHESICSTRPSASASPHTVYSGGCRFSFEVADFSPS